MNKWSKKLEKDGWHFLYKPNGMKGEALDLVTIITHGYSADSILEDLNVCTQFAHPTEDINKLAETIKLVWNDLCENGRITESTESVLKEAIRLVALYYKGVK